MPIVHLETGSGEEGFRRDHPEFPFQIGSLRFSINEADRADWLVAVSDMAWLITTTVPHERRILLVREPSGHFPPAFVNQFGIVVSPWDVPGRTGIWVQDHAALCAMFDLGPAPGDPDGRTYYRRLMTLPVPDKTDAISVVVSSKSMLPGHRRRLRFVRRLAASLGLRLQVYGRGIRPIANKADAIMPFKYHLVLENTVMPSYWTEKLADAYLGYAFPIVSGPPDLTRWFSGESFLPIDIDDAGAAVAAIVDAMNRDVYSDRMEAILDARNRVMLNERQGPVIARVIAAHPSTVSRLAQAETIRPAPKQGPMARLSREIRRMYWQVESRIRA